jgi:puromycin-sensitive aminopeptidase
VLTYEKGAAVLRMLEQFLGAEVFRKGISGYLKKHQYNNTETGDLWDALEAASGQPVRSMMDTWIFQQGFPVVSAAPAADGHGLTITQRRFFFAPPENPEPQLWHVPVMIRACTDKGVETHKLLLTEGETTLKLPGKVEWALVNEGGHGFYRVRYSPELLASLTKNHNILKPIERYGLVSDTWAATVAGLTPLAEFIKMARLFRDETDINVWRALIGAFAYLEMIAAEPQRPAVAAAVREIVGPAAVRLGWTPAQGEDELQGQLRASLVNAMGTIGEDKAVQARARELYDAWQQDPAKADRDLQPAFVSILAHSGDAARYQDFKKHFKSARTPQEEQRYLFSLANFRDIALLRQTMEMTLNGEVRTQNSPYLLHSLLANNVSRIEAWEYIKRNWETIVGKFPDSALPRMCEAINGLLDRQKEVEEFFHQHKVRLGGKLIDQHLERLSVAVAFRQREGAKLEASLKA